MHIRLILFAMGAMIILLGIAMIPCAIIDAYDRSDYWLVFSGSAAINLLLGLSMTILTQSPELREPRFVGQRPAFILTSGVWLLLPLIAALPIAAHGFGLTNALFESVSALTTTGSTVVTGLDEQSRGLLLWRAILQWIGGIGIIVTAIVLLPILRVGGMQLFSLESSDVSGKILASISQIAGLSALIYLVLSVFCAAMYAANGMTSFDAIAHAMTTMAAGGLSTHDASIGYYGAGVESVAILFMILASLPFAAFILLVRGDIGAFLGDAQIRLFLAIILGASVLLVGIILLRSGGGVQFNDPMAAVRTCVFTVVSIISGTGYSSVDFSRWGPETDALLLILMFIGGCAGSAACGMKVFRIDIGFRVALAHAKRMIHPNRLVLVRYRGKVLGDDTLRSVMIFVFVYLMTFIMSAAILGVIGLDPMTAISAAATSVSNVGPGLGPVIGASGSFETLPALAKWVLIGNMLLGRLEFLAVLVVFSRRFWFG